MTSDREELENTIYHLEYCANNIFQDDFQEKIERQIKKLKRKLEKIQ
jgi:ribosome-associated translation inhibitor RaiA